MVAVDPGKVSNRMLADGERGMLAEPISLPSSRDGIERLSPMIERAQAPKAVAAALHLTC